jgi:hypothetical protein
MSNFLEVFQQYVQKGYFTRGQIFHIYLRTFDNIEEILYLFQDIL